jgi:molecular chaperone DnaK (HSP70)
MPNVGRNKYAGGVKINGLPRKPAGESKMKMIFTIDIYGILKVKFYSLDNGNWDFYTLDINGLLDDYKK